MATSETRRNLSRAHARHTAKRVADSAPMRFLVVAALQAQPQQAKGLDSSLRVLAAAPLGPWLLVLVAIGLIMFGAFSCCEARWRKVI